jgi:CO/xanthine dehydrogenase Mo-binding subunit
MEPQTCTAHVTADRVDIWTATQDAMSTLATAAAAAGVKEDKVVVHPLLLGGGFGRRNVVQDFVRLAVLIAKEVPQPVKMLWSREQDIAHDIYRPFGMARLVASLDSDGMPEALTIRLTGPSFVASLVPQFGAVSTTRRMHSIARALSTNSRMPRESIRISTGAASSATARRISPYSMPLRKRPGGISDQLREYSAASRSTRRAIPIAPRWWRFPSPAAGCASTA